MILYQIGLSYASAPSCPSTSADAHCHPERSRPAAESRDPIVLTSHSDSARRPEGPTVFWSGFADSCFANQVPGTRASGNAQSCVSSARLLPFGVHALACLLFALPWILAFLVGYWMLTLLLRSSAAPSPSSTTVPGSGSVTDKDGEGANPSPSQKFGPNVQPAGGGPGRRTKLI